MYSDKLGMSNTDYIRTNERAALYFGQGINLQSRFLYFLRSRLDIVEKAKNESIWLHEFSLAIGILFLTYSYYCMTDKWGVVNTIEIELINLT